MAKLPSMEELLDSGAHFGHQSKRWNPKMSPYIFGQQSGIHIIDLEKTEKQLERAAEFIKEVASRGGVVLFLSTKRQLSEIVEGAAKEAGAMFLTERWFGGLLTNFDSVKKTIEKLGNLEEELKTAEGRYTKKEQLLMQREIDKLIRVLGGIRSLDRLPDCLFIIDAKREDNAVREANKMGIPIVALVDTNGDPTKVNYPVAANDDSVKSVSLLVKTIALFYKEGRSLHEKKEKVAEVKKVAEEAKV
ncbi:MAG: 30S ribosomal protein S2 [Candidatus Woykebacteria bacterium RBG_13_40_15]|uniref:Small ribosomal subunit protein uS2 n=1 Tax=Candidatus Woykebacteria bacterium RBG_13_40_15 TaxID=1802593 RepID=A0A1G1W6B2_9BACT|nr:MAG: 30S ribosomal protein S2 [Candidatus Woykebacteria bacterium RBG_13_40_15]